MEALFKDGEALAVAKMWLEGTSQLRMANAALIIANLARSGKYRPTQEYWWKVSFYDPFMGV